MKDYFLQRIVVICCAMLFKENQVFPATICESKRINVTLVKFKITIYLLLCNISATLYACVKCCYYLTDALLLILTK